MKKIIFATKNKGKLREVKNIFEGSPYEIISLLDFSSIPEIIEDRETFEENALLKAKTVSEYFQLPALGDDSGLAVEQLNWGPGVYSARYAGENASDEENNLKLLKELEKFPAPHLARFVCAAVFYKDGKSFTSLGEVYGQITMTEKGNNGFGYDPLFIPDGYEQTMGELDLSLKNQISHRSRAFRKLKFLIENNME